MSAAAAIVIRRKRLVRAFREAGAIDPTRAATPEQLGQRRSWVFDQMAAHSVFIATADGRYYLNEQAAVEFLAARRKRALTITGVLLLLFALQWLLGLLRR
jgi:hypothetical protein